MIYELRCRYLFVQVFFCISCDREDHILFTYQNSRKGSVCLYNLHSKLNGLVNSFDRLRKLWSSSAPCGWVKYEPLAYLNRMEDCKIFPYRSFMKSVCYDWKQGQTNGVPFTLRHCPSNVKCILVRQCFLGNTCFIKKLKSDLCTIPCMFYNILQGKNYYQIKFSNFLENIWNS